jgi:predicted negative regulator of RcsB-dependent stress response
LRGARARGINSPAVIRMPIAKEATTDPALEAQVFWHKYRREIAILLGLAVLGVVAVAGYRLYRERREATAATLFSAAKTPAAYEELINQHSDTAAAASAYLLLADAQRKDGKYAEAIATLGKFLEKFPRHELATIARMAMAANLQAMGKEDEAFATYQQIASANVPGFNAPMALIEQVHILQEKGKTEDARRICETIITQYRDSYAAMEASQLLRTFLKTAKPEAAPVVASPQPGAPVTATVPPTMKVLPAAPPAPSGAPSVPTKPSAVPATPSPASSVTP